MAVQQVQNLPAPFIEAAGQTYLADLQSAIGDLKGKPLSSVLGPQFVAGPSALTQQAQSLAGGLGSFAPFLQTAAASTGPQAYQQFLSPFQQDVIKTTLDEFDVQAQKGLPALRAQAIGAGAFGGGREGVQLAEYQSQSDRNRAALQAQLLQQGFGQASDLAARAFQQQQALAQQQLGLGEFSRGLASLQPALESTVSQGLGTTGTGALAFNQALLDAAQQRAQLAYQEPISRLNVFGSGLASQAGGVPTTTQTTSPATPQASPLSQALQVGLSAYGLGSLFGRG